MFYLCEKYIENSARDLHFFYLRLPEAKAGLGVQSLRPSVRPSQNLVIATLLKLLIHLS